MRLQKRIPLLFLASEKMANGFGHDFDGIVRAAARRL
jgi:hypothetical protein